MIEKIPSGQLLRDWTRGHPKYNINSRYFVMRPGGYEVARRMKRLMRRRERWMPEEDSIITWKINGKLFKGTEAWHATL